MSAIFGIMHLSDQAVERAHLERMDAALARHGNTGSLWMKGAVGIGQRLMSFTPEDLFERQPLVSNDGRFVLVSDGRVDNRTQLFSSLELRSLETSTSVFTDGELILRAYEKWGEACVHHLVGVFAFAIWETRKQRLFAARSPITAPPLVYHATLRSFAFSTVPSGLFALPFVSCAIDEQVLAYMLAQIPMERGSTFLQGISLLPSGHTLTIGNEGLNVRCYWQPNLQREIRFRRDEDYVEAFTELLENVVGEHLRSLTPVGVMMSGGLDSSAVAATAARLLKGQRRRLTAFTEVPRKGFGGPVPNGTYADETPYVEAIAAMHDNLDLSLVRTGEQTFFDGLDQRFDHLEMPFRNTSNFVWIEAIYREARQRGIRTMLDGSQGNLTFSRNGTGLLPYLLRSGRWVLAVREANAQVRRGNARSLLRVLLRQGILPLLPFPMWRAIERRRGNELAASTQPWRSLTPINPEFAAMHKVDERARDWKNSLYCRPAADTRLTDYEALVSQDIGIYLPYIRAMFGVDPRSVPADVRIAEFCLSIPEEQFMRKGESRSLIRRAMAGHLPLQVLSNGKRGLQAADWFERLTGIRDSLPAELERIEQSDLARRALDLRRMRDLVDHWPKDGSAVSRTIYEYNSILERGLMAGRFLLWMEKQA